jgi:hypothetical protein
MRLIEMLQERKSGQAASSARYPGVALCFPTRTEGKHDEKGGESGFVSDVPYVGLEPTTTRLRAARSTN